MDGIAFRCSRKLPIHLSFTQMAILLAVGLQVHCCVLCVAVIGAVFRTLSRESAALTAPKTLLPP